MKVELSRFVMLLAVMISVQAAVCDTVDDLRNAFMDANAQAGAESNAVECAVSYFAATRSPGAFPLAATNATRMPHGNWTVRYIYGGLSPTFWHTAFLMADGRVLRANETNAEDFIRAEFPGVMTTDDRLLAFRTCLSALRKGKPLSAATDIPGYEAGQLSQECADAIASAWIGTNDVPLVRFCWDERYGAIIRGEMSLTSSNTFNDISFSVVTSGIGRVEGGYE